MSSTIVTRTPAQDAHIARWFEALAKLKANRHTADSNWRALLWVLTSRDYVWAKVECFIDYRKAEVHRRRNVDLSSGEYLMVRLALHLFNDSNPSPKLADLAWTLDPGNWQTFLEACDILRGQGNPKVLSLPPAATSPAPVY